MEESLLSSNQGRAALIHIITFYVIPLKPRILLRWFTPKADQWSVTRVKTKTAQSRFAVSEGLDSFTLALVVN